MSAFGPFEQIPSAAEREAVRLNGINDPTRHLRTTALEAEESGSGLARGPRRRIRRWPNHEKYAHMEVSGSCRQGHARAALPRVAAASVLGHGQGKFDKAVVFDRYKPQVRCLDAKLVPRHGNLANQLRRITGIGALHLRGDGPGLAVDG